jgi:glycosyltransferase involved in cell wall biosynthesis
LELRKHYFAGKIANYDAILSSPYAPPVTVIAPAYNESVTIVENIRALLSLYYPTFEIVIVNDGSKDDTLEKVIAAFELEKVPYVIDYKIRCNKIRGIISRRNRPCLN